MEMVAAYAHKIVRITISGTCFGGAEDWSTGFYMGSPTTDVTGVNAPGAQSVAIAWQTFFTNATSKVSNAFQTTQVKAAMIDTNGKTLVDDIDYYNYPTAISGGGGANWFPPQISLAATLTSDNQRGLAAKGRMYLPGVNAGIQATSAKMLPADVTGIVTNLKTFLDSVNTAPGVSGKVILASKGRKSQDVGTDGQPIYIGGVSAWVTGCRLGDVYDTQRRRRNGLAETYQTRVLA
jgi:hypothetical protein